MEWSKKCIGWIKKTLSPTADDTTSTADIEMPKIVVSEPPTTKEEDPLPITRDDIVSQLRTLEQQAKEIQTLRSQLLDELRKLDPKSRSLASSSKGPKK